MRRKGRAARETNVVTKGDNAAGRLLCALIFLFLLGGAARAATTGPSTTTRPTTPIAQANCVTSKCHVNIKSTAVLHGPVATDNCDACHALTSAQKHTFTIRRAKADLCTYCHEFSVKAMPVVHKPVTQGECLGCHDPHGGRNKAIVREATTTELCGRCHDSITRNKTFLHGPVAKGECDSCHTPHASRFPKLLDVVGTDLCLTCHVEFEPAVSSAKFQHKANKANTTMAIGVVMKMPVESRRFASS